MRVTPIVLVCLRRKVVHPSLFVCLAQLANASEQYMLKYILVRTISYPFLAAKLAGRKSVQLSREEETTISSFPGSECMV